MEEPDEPRDLPFWHGWLQSKPAMRQVPRRVQPPGKPRDTSSLSSEAACRETPEMTRGVISRLSDMFGTKWGRIGIVGTTRECFFNRSSLLSQEEFDDLAYGSEVEFDEQPDRTHGSRAVRLTIVRTGPASNGANK
jgi:cold shock CspA family protein